MLLVAGWPSYDSRTVKQLLGSKRSVTPAVALLKCHATPRRDAAQTKSRQLLRSFLPQPGRPASQPASSPAELWLLPTEIGIYLTRRSVTHRKTIAPRCKKRPGGRRTGGEGSEGSPPTRAATPPPSPQRGSAAPLTEAKHTGPLTDIGETIVLLKVKRDAAPESSRLTDSNGCSGSLLSRCLSVTVSCKIKSSVLCELKQVSCVRCC